jgi:hypothetical protein
VLKPSGLGTSPAALQLRLGTELTDLTQAPKAKPKAKRTRPDFSEALVVAHQLLKLIKPPRGARGPERTVRPGDPARRLIEDSKKVVRLEKARKREARRLAPIED